MPKKKITEETIVKNQIKEFLDKYDWFHMPLLQGMGCKPGIADRYALKDGINLWIEVKSAKGKQTDTQKEFEEEIREQGGHYVLARSPEDIVRYLAKIGMPLF